MFSSMLFLGSYIINNIYRLWHEINKYLIENKYIIKNYENKYIIKNYDFCEYGIEIWLIFQFKWKRPLGMRCYRRFV